MSHEGFEAKSEGEVKEIFHGPRLIYILLIYWDKVKPDS